MRGDHAAHPAAEATPVARLVLLGASNLTKELGLVVATARRASPGPVHIFSALGHGRSYGISSRFFSRELTGILQCGLWPALADSPPLPLSALVTDIGNDILYGVAVPQIVRWVEECVARLLAAGARVAITGLPVDNLRTISRARFLFFRRLMVPQCRLDLPEVSSRAHALNDAVADMAARRGLALVLPQRAWYGLDPIHVSPPRGPAGLANDHGAAGKRDRPSDE